MVVHADDEIRFRAASARRAERKVKHSSSSESAHGGGDAAAPHRTIAIVIRCQPVRLDARPHCVRVLRERRAPEDRVSRSLYAYTASALSTARHTLPTHRARTIRHLPKSRELRAALLAVGPKISAR